MTFDEMGLSPLIMKAIAELSYTKPTDIQEKAIPLLLKHEGDFVGQAQTGTGKTAAFLIPLLERLDSDSGTIQALVLSPTRELANQIHNEFKKVSKHLPVESLTVYGGVSYSDQLRSLKKGCQVVIGTPGRTIDLIKRGALKLNNCTQLVIDEADEMLNMGFLEDVQIIINRLSKDRKSWMFSATIPRPINELIKRNFSDPKIITIEKKAMSSENISQYFCPINKKDFSKALRLICAHEKDCFGIIFCETRVETKKVTDDMVSFGLSTLVLNGDLNQSQRDHALGQFKNKKIHFLVCTDVASRGIDVSHITHVFNFGLPRQREAYIHRIGRTGRAGKTGTAISFVSGPDLHKLRNIERLTGKKIEPYKLPNSNEVKRKTILFALEKMNATKEALSLRGEEFSIDSTYSHFADYFKDSSKEHALKIIFSDRFKREMRQIEEQLNVQEISSSSAPASRKKSSQRRQGRRRKPRSFNNRR